MDGYNVALVLLLLFLLLLLLFLILIFILILLFCLMPRCEPARQTLGFVKVF
jgi:hypothetical protein